HLGRQLEARPAPRLPGRLLLRARPVPGARPRRDQRLQGLPDRAAAADPARSDPVERLRVPDRDDLLDPPSRRSHRRAPDNLRRPPGRRLEDGQRHRRRGDAHAVPPLVRLAAPTPLTVAVRDAVSRIASYGWLSAAALDRT